MCEHEKEVATLLDLGAIPPVDLHWFFEISIRTEKKSVKTEKKFQLFHN